MTEFHSSTATLKGATRRRQKYGTRPFFQSLSPSFTDAPSSI
jgi:hypothetical protein